MSAEAAPSWQLACGGFALVTLAIGASMIYEAATGNGEWYDAVGGVLILLCGIAIAIMTFTGGWGQ